MKQKNKSVVASVRFTKKRYNQLKVHLRFKRLSFSQFVTQAVDELLREEDAAQATTEADTAHLRIGAERFAKKFGKAIKKLAEE